MLEYKHDVLLFKSRTVIKIYQIINFTTIQDYKGNFGSIKVFFQKLEFLFTDLVYISIKSPDVVNNWTNFIGILFTNIGNNIYSVYSNISYKQYYEFYNGLIRKFRDEKKLGDHNQCFQAKKHGLRLATIDRPLFAQSILTSTKSVLCRDNSNGLLVFEPNPSEEAMKVKIVNLQN